MNKKLLILLAFALIVVPVAASCGRLPVKTGVPIAPAVGHPIDVRYENCNACHVQDQLDAKPLPHLGLNYTNAQCTQKGCHAVQGAVTTTTTPPVSTTTIPPVSTTTTPGGSTTSGGSTTPVSSTPAAATLPAAAVAITTHTAAQLASYKGLCQMCHGPGTTNSNPYPPTWDGKANGSTVNTGKYTVVAGSTQDHSQYTVDQCTQAGCHAVPAK